MCKNSKQSKPKSDLSAAANTCYFCNMPVLQKPGRGRPRIAHDKCWIVSSRLKEIGRLLGEIELKDEATLKMIRGNIQSEIINGPLHWGAARKRIKDRDAKIQREGSSDSAESSEEPSDSMPTL